MIQCHSGSSREVMGGVFREQLGFVRRFTAVTQAREDLGGVLWSLRCRIHKQICHYVPIHLFQA